MSEPNQDPGGERMALREDLLIVEDLMLPDGSTKSYLSVGGQLWWTCHARAINSVVWAGVRESLVSGLRLV
jgi:hypothetical protein